MSGVTIKFEGKKELDKRLQKMIGRFTDLRPLHKLWSVSTHRWVMRNFQSEGQLTGEPWQRLSARTLDLRRGNTSRILQDTGRLRASFQPRHDGEKAEVGTAVEYAPQHQFGKTAAMGLRVRLPKRPMLPEKYSLISRDIEAITLRYIRGSRQKPI